MEDPSASTPSPAPISAIEDGQLQSHTSPELSPKPPSLRNSSDFTPGMSASSAPLGPVNAARRPVPQARASGLTSDIAAKMKAFSLSRQGAPNAVQGLRPGLLGTQQISTGSIQTSASPVGGPLGNISGSPGGGIAGLRLPPGMNRPNAPSFQSISAGGTPRSATPKMPMGGLAAKRGLKPGGMKLSDATKPPEPSADGTTAAGNTDSGSQFNKFSDIVDTKMGTLNFKNKAVIHGSGIDFDTGRSFSISLDEVDTIDELGKGNYGTVFKVRHARPRIRRPGQGLRGNMRHTSSNSIASVESDDSTQSAPATTSGLIMAMKEIRLELEDSKFAQIIMELDILHRCISPFIISFYGGFFQEGSVYICMEHMDGGSIDKLYGGGVPEGVLKKITLSTVMGLKYLKDEHNIIHRDVKPTNILVNTRGQIKICDFGVSGNLVASVARTNIGCQSYMAPERISGGGMSAAGSGGGSYSVQSDIWSLGLTIIECALGRYPYPPETYDNIFSQLSVCF
jgi:mitogen-activated protein kinase kinase